MFSGLTLPRCQRLSSSARCLTATCAEASRCCILQPPQAPVCRPKCGQPGRTRWEDSRRIAVTVPCSQLFLRRCTLNCTSSKGKAPSMKVTMPAALWATPCASRSRDSTWSHSGSGYVFFVLLSSVGSVIPRIVSADKGENGGRDCTSVPAGSAPDRPACPGGGFRSEASRDRHRCCPSRRSSGPSAPTGLPSRAASGCARRP